MASKVYISVVVVSWVLCVFMHSTNMFIIAAVSVAASESSPLQLEAKALRESGWWSGLSNETSLSHCEWNEIECNDGGSVTGIFMGDVYLGDKIIRKFNFSSFPNLVRSIRQQIGTPSKLTFLCLSSNNLTAHFPFFLMNLTQLESFYIYQNLISGPIPEELGNLKNLQVLGLNSNKITGSIPEILGDLKNLQILILGNNKLTGLISSALGILTNLHNLTRLNLESNQFNGSIPLEIGNMKSLTILNLSNNNIVGEIPSTIGHLTNLSYLSLSWNEINGSMPVEIANCILTRSIPSQFSDLVFLCFIDLSYNNLTGSVPLYLVNLEFNLSYNSLKGQISTIFRNHSFDAFIGNKDLCGDFGDFFPCLSSSQTVSKIKMSLPLIIFIVLLLLGYFFPTLDLGLGKHNPIHAKQKMGTCSHYQQGTSTLDTALEQRKVVALKKLHRLEAEDPTFDKSCRNEVKMLTKFQH
ncbi:putative leucine-rich repeat receptor-like protein kinase [Quercus suber]|uniref:Leucine-rich repeat receptor-like protein kinase n=1 Tax=Quercus suber TaxID=58331 RepID=A0AAW0L8W8_QUESU